MRQKYSFEYWLEVGKHVNKFRSFAWFYGLSIPTALLFGFALHCYNTYVNDKPSLLELFIMMMIGLGLFSVVTIVLWFKVFKPVVKEYDISENNDKK